MSFLELLTNSSRAFQGKEPSLARRPWIALVYIMSLILSCLLISFVMMRGSMFTTVLVVGLTLMPTVVLLGMLRFYREEPVRPSPAPYAPEEPNDEWDSGDSVEIAGIHPDATDSQ